MTKAPYIGSVQLAFLRAVNKHRGGEWYWGCGWYWKNPSHDIRLARSLAKKGLLQEEMRKPSTWRDQPVPDNWSERPVFTLTPLGKKVADGEL